MRTHGTIKNFAAWEESNLVGEIGQISHKMLLGMELTKPEC